jgi:Bacterial regulatory proteins, tetR family
MSFRRHLRAEAIRAAHALTVEKGWDRVRVAEVAALIGVSRPTLYKEFGDKQGLGDVLVLDEAQRFPVSGNDKSMVVDQADLFWRERDLGVSRGVQLPVSGNDKTSSEIVKTRNGALDDPVSGGTPIRFDGRARGAAMTIDTVANRFVASGFRPANLLA